MSTASRWSCSREAPLAVDFKVLNGTREVFSGHVKWDGCMEYQAAVHLCGPEYIDLKVSKVLRAVYAAAHPLMSGTDYDLPEVKNMRLAP